MRQASYTLALVLAVACGGQVWAKTELLKTSAGSPAHWLRGQITVGLDHAAGSRVLISEQVNQAVERANQLWNGVHAGQPRLKLATEGTPDVSVRFCQDAWRGDGIDLANTQFTASLRDGTVTGATIELNECDHDFAAPGKPRQGQLNLQNLLTHELGHALGLGHSNNPNSIMYPSGTGGGPSRPHREDEIALALVYFGRPLEATESPTANELEPPDRTPQPDVPPPTPRTPEVAAAQGAPEQVPAMASQPAHGPFAPMDSVSVLNLKTNEGRAVMVYTCEPTLLPPMTEAPLGQSPKRHTSHHQRARPR